MMKYLLLATLTITACGKKPAEGAAAPAAVTAPQVTSGLYTSAREGDCFCVNAEKKIAGHTQTMAAMGGGVNLGTGFESLEKDDGRRAALIESFQLLKAVDKNSIRSGDTLYLRASTAKNCEVLNTRILSAVNYAQACLGEGTENIEVEQKKF
ncbi:MAG: hypothetical protein J0L53_13070 [Spirochaetes bacterium]|nr:hypothetical protein [Spirochaetota bacterium]